MSESTGATRRQFIAAGAGAAAGAYPLVGAAAGVARGRRHHQPKGLAQVEHIVILMQENISFDRYFGTLRGVRGFSDPHAMRLANGDPVFKQPFIASPTGSVLPWHLSIANSDPCHILVDNGWNPMHKSLDGGKMDGFAGAETPYTMSYFTRADIPWHLALADAFTVCDGYFSSALGPTNPNRLYSMTGTIDPAGKAGGPVTDNSEKPVYRWRTYPERLQRKKISWRIYQQEDNFDDNALAWFAQYQAAKPGSPLYENGMKRRPANAFANDVASGKLPQVSWIIAPTAQSEHPGYSPGLGADFCNSVFEALFAHPKVWAKTVLIFTYDEPGGYFDHVRPPLPPAGTKDEFVGGQPIGLGFRVPTVICSPWSRGGFVCSRTFDHTSTIKFIERRFGVHEPNISAWRRKTVGDLVDTLDFSHRDMSIPKLPATAPLAAASANACAHNLPPVPTLINQQMPVQEPGTRRRRH
jgi:phospholipase C